MRLLFDQNLSPRLVQRLQDIYPDGSHVSQVGLDRSPDVSVWEYARAHDYAIVTKDSDFSDMSVVRGFPPKVIWLRLGNCTSVEVERVLRQGREAIEAFFVEPATGVLELF